jgi:hypothetical protein
MSEATGMYADLLGSAIDNINFREVAESWIDDVYHEWFNNPPYIDESDDADDTEEKDN